MLWQPHWKSYLYVKVVTYKRFLPARSSTCLTKCAISGKANLLGLMNYKSSNEAGPHSLFIASTKITGLVMKNLCVDWGERTPRTL